MQFHSNGWAICCRGSRTRSASWRPRRCSRSRWAHLAPDDRVMDLGLLSHQACTGGVDEHQVAPAVWRPAHRPTEHAYGASLSFATTTHLWPLPDPPSRKPPQRNQPHWDRPVNSGPRPCLVSVGFPLSGSRDRTSTSDLIRHALRTSASPYGLGSTSTVAGQRKPSSGLDFNWECRGRAFPAACAPTVNEIAHPRLQRTRIVDAAVPDRASPLNAVLLLVTQAGCEGVTRRGCRGLESPGRFGNACRRQFVSTNSCSGTSSGTAAWPSCCLRRSHAM